MGLWSLFKDKPETKKPETDEELEARRIAAWDRWTWETGNEKDKQEFDECTDKQRERVIYDKLGGILKQMQDETVDEDMRDIIHDLLKQHHRWEEKEK